MRKVYFIIGTIFTIAALGCESPKVAEVIEKDCVVTEVEYFQIGQKHTLQIDPEWRIKTNCGTTHTSRKAMRVGDTVQIKIVKYKKN
jgi:hypothetical protein